MLAVPPVRVNLGRKFVVFNSASRHSYSWRLWLLYVLRTCMYGWLDGWICRTTIAEWDPARMARHAGRLLVAQTITSQKGHLLQELLEPREIRAGRAWKVGEVLIRWGGVCGCVDASFCTQAVMAYAPAHMGQLFVWAGSCVRIHAGVIIHGRIT